MRKWLILFLAFVLLLSGCSVGKEDASSSSRTNTVFLEERSMPSDFTIPNVDAIESLLEQMTVEEKLGQLFIFGFESKSFSPQLKEMIQKHHIGGLILLGRNVSTADHMVAVLNEAKAANQVNQIPLFLSVDEEGGRVSRLPKGIRKLPSAQKVGQRQNGAYNYRTGEYLAELLQSFGYNMNYAPVLDVHSNPANPVIGDRAYASSAQVVADLGIETMNGMKDHGVIPVIKHFPGHGDTAVDSHHSLPVVEKSLEELKQTELLPFQQAIDKGADVVMVAHVVYPALDSKWPASMSSSIISDLLREQMGFQGVIITDDLTMGAITNDHSVSEAALQSFLAGSDVLLIAGDEDEQLKTIQLFNKSVASGAISEERLNESVRRILELKEAYGLEDDPVQSFDAAVVNNTYKKLVENQ
ncbi:glycoside hydrolase family 3 [Sporosarcina sp. NCCP-2222]|uniref:beta-N-acetylhexosaminidase n=1 Tax=Sporosarcina sp. NCCP-2222 TaxID=2935073 RepID=UPI00208043F9|nr:beta-N-acetylhexosaminidase [Sporosarcina sp. NCCP-2222]GKV54685.1 glycoside hydrolase family 3 [Sporosarcina sp. NCCP-2222]